MRILEQLELCSDRYRLNPVRITVKFSACMRSHGVPNFPDPTFISGGQGITVRVGGAGINPRSPAFQQAEKICGRR